MNSSKPYLLRALYEWIVDNGCTPHLLVASDMAGVQVPDGYAQDGRIVLNIAPGAVRDLLMDNEQVSFSARFAGRPHAIRVPVAAVTGLYARENGQGMSFEPEVPPEPQSPAPDTAGRPSLRVVK